MIDRGIDNVLERLLKISASEQAADTTEAEQLERLAQRKRVDVLARHPLREPVEAPEPTRYAFDEIPPELMGRPSPREEELGFQKELGEQWKSGNLLDKLRMLGLAPYKGELFKSRLEQTPPTHGLWAIDKVFEPFRWIGEAFAAAFIASPEMREDEKKHQAEVQERLGSAKSEEEREVIFSEEAERARKMFLPGGKLREEYEKLPWYAQMAAETPGYLSLGQALNLPFKLGKWGLGKLKPPAPIPPTAEVPIVDEAVTKLTNLFKQKVKPLRTQIEEAKSEALKAKMPDFAEKLERAKSFEDVQLAYATLKGKRIPPGADIRPTAEEFKPQEIAGFIERINMHPAFEKLRLTAGNTIRALERLLVEGKLPTEGELANLELVFGKEFANAVRSQASTWTKTSKVITEIINLPKSVVASGDLGGPMRQTVFMLPYETVMHPRHTLECVWAGLRSAFDGRYFNAMNKAIAESRFAPVRTEMGLDITQVAGTLRGREEAYIGSWLFRLAENWGKQSLPKKIISAPLFPVAKFAQMSERTLLGYLNKMRADVFDRYAALWEFKAGDKELRALAEVINIFSGRGVAPKPISGLIPLLNNAWFSPRLQLSRVQALSLPLYRLWTYPPMVMRYTIANIVSFVGTIGAIVAGLKISSDAGLLPGVSVESDARSADFGKIKIGDTRLDPWGGHQQYVKLIWRLLTSETKTGGKRIVEIDREDQLMDFLRMKENPLVGLIHDLFRGETFLGEELTSKPEDVQRETKERLIPFFIRDVIEAMHQDGLTGALTAAPGFVGVGVVSYPSRAYADWLSAIEDRTGKEWTTEDMIRMRPDFNKAEASWLEYFELPSGRARKYYLQSNPEIDASLYFWGEKRTMETPEARQRVREMANEYGLPMELFPIREAIEPYEPEDKEPTEIFYDLLDVVPQYWSNYLMENQAQFEGQDLVGHIRMLEVEKDRDLRLLNEYEDMAANPRVPEEMKTKYRILIREQRPDIDVALNIWGRVGTVRSSEAMALLKQRAEQLGIPFEVLPAVSSILKKKPEKETKARPAPKGGKKLGELARGIFGK